MGLPVISEILDITPDFIKTHFFILFLVGDTAISFLFALGTNFGDPEATKGIIGTVITEVVSFITGVRIIISTWQLLFLVILIQAGILKLIFNMMIAHSNSNP